MIRFWAIVLAANLAGTLIFAALISPQDLFKGPVYQAMIASGRESVSGTFAATFLKAVFAGWLVAMTIWLLPSARSARMFVIIFLTNILAVGRFSHIIAGSIDSAFLVFSGNGSLRDYVLAFFIPTVLGNTVGGVSLVALLNHPPLATELRGDGETGVGR